MITKPEGRKINFPSVFTSNWELDNGSKAQFFVNYLPIKQEITLDIDDLENVKIFIRASDNQGKFTRGKELKLRISPLSAVMVTYIN